MTEERGRPVLVGQLYSYTASETDHYRQARPTRSRAKVPTGQQDEGLEGENMFFRDKMPAPFAVPDVACSKEPKLPRMLLPHIRTTHRGGGGVVYKYT